MSRALVLGGGGPVGIGWQAGLVVGLADAGVTLGQADLVVGTSAGAVVGAMLTSGRDLADVVVPMSQVPPWAPSAPGTASTDLAETFARGDAGAVDEDAFVGRFAFVGGGPWPATLRCTSVGVESGRLTLWDHTAGVELHRAVAASCSVPGISPAVTIAGEQYIDGGVRDVLNADLAIGHDIVVAVTCLVLDPPSGLVPEFVAERLPAVRTRIEELRSSASAVEVVEPSDEFRELSGWGTRLMDFARTPAAFEAGVAQGRAQADRLGPIWSA